MLTKNRPQASWVHFFMGAVCLSTIALGGCSSDSLSTNPNSSDNSDNDEMEIAVVTDFADNVVIPTYQQLELKAKALTKAVNTFISNPTAETLQAAQQAWIQTRYPWEQSEAFAFGPADSLGYDGDLDDWPVNETDVAAILQDKATLNEEAVKNLQTTEKGFHTIELLLFGDDNNKTAANFTERELQLLKLLTVAFEQTAIDLTKSWTTGVAGNPAYREVLATAGNSDNQAYPTVKAAVAEIVQGIMGCLDEVANEKIGEPLDTKETEGLESRFSHSSLKDFQNNIQSVANAYLGRVSDTSTNGKSLSDLVAATVLGRFGWKANNPNLLQQSASAYVNDMGVTNPLFPEPDGTSDIDEETLENAEFYVQTLAVPARNLLNDPQVQRGEELFNQAKCNACHVDTLQTGRYEVRELANQTIHPYTDLLLHDMGSDLADNRPDFLATGTEWRTPPLWGIGLTQTVLPYSLYLHDGRAQTLEEAILWHGGEAKVSREAFKNLNKSDRTALVKFLRSL